MHCFLVFRYNIIFFFSTLLDMQKFVIRKLRLSQTLLLPHSNHRGSVQRDCGMIGNGIFPTQCLVYLSLGTRLLYSSTLVLQAQHAYSSSSATSGRLHVLHP